MITFFLLLLCVIVFVWGYYEVRDVYNLEFGQILIGIALIVAVGIGIYDYDRGTSFEDIEIYKKEINYLTQKTIYANKDIENIDLEYEIFNTLNTLRISKDNIAVSAKNIEVSIKENEDGTMDITYTYDITKNNVYLISNYEENVVVNIVID